MKLRTKIAPGLVLGALVGGAFNALFTGAEWVLWIGDHIAGPV